MNCTFSAYQSCSNMCSDQSCICISIFWTLPYYYMNHVVVCWLADKTICNSTTLLAFFQTFSLAPAATRGVPASFQRNCERKRPRRTPSLHNLASSIPSAAYPSSVLFVSLAPSSVSDYWYPSAARSGAEVFVGLFSGEEHPPGTPTPSLPLPSCCAKLSSETLT
jgi:hypothetical protein